MALDGLGEKLKNLFKPKEDPRFKGQGRRLGAAEAHPSVARPQQPQPAADGGRGTNRAPPLDTNGPAEAPSPMKPPPQPLGPGGCSALMLSKSHRTEDVVLDAAVMANTPTGKEAHLMSAHKPPGGTPSHLGPGSPPSHPASPPYPASAPQATASACSPTDCGVVGGISGLTVEVPRTSTGGGRGGPGGARTGGHAAGSAGREHGQFRSATSNLSSMVSTISTPTAAEKRMGGFRCAAPPTDGAMADYGVAPASSQAYELQRCLALVLSSQPLSRSNTSTVSSNPPVAAASAPLKPPPPPVSGAVVSATAGPPSPSSASPAAAGAQTSAAGSEAAPAAQCLDPSVSSSLLSRSSTAMTSTSTAAGAEAGAATAAAPGGGPSGDAAEGGAAGPPAGPRECCDALLRVLRNVLTRPEEPKFRQIRLSNPRVQETIVEVPGAVEFLEGAGFQMRFSPDDGSDTANQGYLILPDEVPPTALAEAFRILAAVMAAHGFSTPIPPVPAADAATSAGQPSRQQQQQSAASTAAAAATAAALAAPAVERCTQVLLPAAPDVAVPDWFFQRTGNEIREQWAAVLRRREEQERFMTRTMREVRRQQEAAEAAAGGSAGGSGSGLANVATVRVRFAEGVCLQGHFGGAEPVSRVFEWVAASLRSPAITFELVKPDRRPLETTTTAAAARSAATAKGSAAAAAAAARAGGAMVPLTVRGADMLPSILLNLRPVGQEAAALAAANMPLLSDELLRTTKPQ